LELVHIDCDTHPGLNLPLRPIVRVGVGGHSNRSGQEVAVEVTLFDQHTGISNYHAVTGSTVGPLLAELENFDVVTLLEPGMTAVPHDELRRRYCDRLNQARRDCES
jgi:hypothetical protein